MKANMDESNVNGINKDIDEALSNDIADSAVSSENDIDEALNSHASEFLMPALHRFSRFLGEAGIAHDLSLADEPMPGIWAHVEGLPDIFCTFFSVLDAEDEEMAFLRLSRPIGAGLSEARLSEGGLSERGLSDGAAFDTADGEVLPVGPEGAFPGAADSGGLPEGIDGAFPGAADSEALPRDTFLRWIFPYYEEWDVEDLLNIFGLFSTNRPFRILLTPSMALTSETTESGDEVIEIEDLAPEATLDYDYSQYACYLRLNTLSVMLSDEEVEQTGVLDGAIPYLQVDFDDTVLSLYYEEIEDSETFLFHIRTDIPLSSLSDRAAAETLCAAFNETSQFSRADILEKDFPVYGFEKEGDECISLHASIPELNGMPGIDIYAAILELFCEEAGELKAYISDKG